MDPASPPITARGLLTLSGDAWAMSCQQAAVIAPLAAEGNIGHAAADAAAGRLGISRRQVYVLVQRCRQGSGVVSDLVPGRSGGGKGQGRLPPPIEDIIRELLHKRYL